MELHISPEEWSKFLTQLDVVEDQLAHINHSILLLANAVSAAGDSSDKTAVIKTLTEHLRASTERLAAKVASVNAVKP